MPKPNFRQNGHIKINQSKNNITKKIKKIKMGKNNASAVTVFFKIKIRCCNGKSLTILFYVRRLGT